VNHGLLSIGLTTLDILGRPIDAIPADGSGRLIESIELVPAGTAGGTALIAAVLGMKVRLVSAVGDDRTGTLVRTVLEEYGVDTGLMPTAPGVRTSATILAIDSRGRRPTFHAPGASMLTEITDAVREAAREARFVHWAAVGAPRIGDKAAPFLAGARTAGATITCDLISPGPRARAELEPILPYIDYFMPSLTEALFLTGCDNEGDAAERLLALGCRACIVKLGERGWLYADAEGSVRGPARNIRVVDTTSCGDSFCAGFIAALDRGWPPEQACRFANAVAALVAQGLGTLGALEGFEQAETLMRSPRA